MKLSSFVLVFAAILALSEQTSKLGNKCTAAGDCDASNKEECKDAKCECQTGQTCDPSPCVADSCNSHGTCTSDGTTAVCACKGGYSGNKCQTDPISCTGQTEADCNYHAKCVSTTCVCLGIYTGDKCETAPASGPCKTDPCGTHGTCTLDETDNTKSTCLCRDNYTGATCRTAHGTPKPHTSGTITGISESQDVMSTTEKSTGERISDRNCLTATLLMSLLGIFFM